MRWPVIGILKAIGLREDFKCSDLASSLYKKFGFETRAPMNLETIRLK
ncbi:MAG: hypothetical protein Q7J68_07815 [Thermoplasmata archaeon]|nr:hypothetical protein [Thermoplasmata archaeon]